MAGFAIMMRNMKFVFFGTPEFGSVVLDNLIKSGFIPSAVVTNPDKPAGRKQILTPSPVKEVALNSGLKIDVLEPLKLRNNPEIVEKIKSYGADLFIVAAYGKIIPKEVIDISKYGIIGVHPSPLPKLRGPSPIQSALLEGLEKTGVALFLIDEEVDHGPVFMERSLEIHDHDNAKTLTHRLAVLSAEMLAELIPNIANFKPVEQNHAEATFTKKFATSDAYIEPENLREAETEGGDIAKTIDRKIRAFNPEPGAWTMREGKRVKLLDSEIKDDKLKLKLIHVEGKKPTIV